jgi:type VI secretion system protein ImpJ
MYKMPIPEALRWHEGMLLSPQHFQQFSARTEALLHHYTCMTTPFAWGVIKAVVDEGLLDQKIFRLQSFEAIMPDGLYVSTPPDQLDLSVYKAEAERGALPIHVVIPASSVADRQGVMARYTVGSGDAVADSDPEADEGQRAVSIPRLRPNITLGAVDIGGGLVQLPVAEVEYVDSAFRLTNYVPPHPKISGEKWGAPLVHVAKQVARLVREKANYLLDMIRSPVGSSNRPRFEQQLNSLMAGLPAFEILLESEEAHPFQLYLALCTLGAQVSAVGAIDEIPQFPRYAHENVMEIFETVGRILSNALEYGVQEGYTEYRFEGEGHSFTLAFRDEWVGKRMVLGFSGQPTPEIIGWADNCYIGTDTHIDSMSKNRDIGAKRVRDDAHEGLRKRPNTVLYTLGEDLRRIEPGETMHVYNPVIGPNDASPQRVLLYVKND